jgi:hypothetical protein
MANKITFTCGLAWTDGKDSIRGNASLTVDQAGDNVIFNLATIDFEAPEELDLGDVTPGFLFFKNNSTANFVTISTDSAMTPVTAKLVPGDAVSIPTTNATWYALADTAPVLLQVIALDA